MSAIMSTCPAWVYRRDGRLVPFDPDRITLALFDASETLGSGNAFLARELTEGVLFFLTEEIGGAVPTTAQIIEIVAKVVRELGHPALARAFLEDQQKPTKQAAPEPVLEERFLFSRRQTPAAVVQNCLAHYSLKAIFSRDLQAAQEEGLITLHGLTAPEECLACVTEPPVPAGRSESQARSFELGQGPLGLIRSLDQARQVAGWLAALDGSEYVLAAWETPFERISEFIEQLQWGCKASGLRVLLNLHGTTPPVWATECPEGPLFARAELPISEESVRPLSEMILDQVLNQEALMGMVGVDWHLQEADWKSPRNGQGSAALQRLAKLALEKQHLAFTFDRPRRPLYLGPGLDRNHPAVLLAVSLHLPALLKFPDVRTDPELFLKKASSLAGMAISAAVQKRAFLRDRQRGEDGELLPVNRRFLLARSRLVVEPVGLEVVVRVLAGRGLCEGQPALQLGQRILRTLNETLQAQCQRLNLKVCLSSLDDLTRAFFSAGSEQLFAIGTEALNFQAPGLTPWDPDAPLTEQLRAAGQLHATGERATALLAIPPDRFVSPEELADLLRLAGRETSIQRLAICRLGPRQLTFSGQ